MHVVLVSGNLGQEAPGRTDDGYIDKGKPLNVGMRQLTHTLDSIFAVMPAIQRHEVSHALDIVATLGKPRPSYQHTLAISNGIFVKNLNFDLVHYEQPPL